MMITTTILPNPAGPGFGEVMLVGKSTQLLSAPSRKVDHLRSMKVVLTCTGTSGISRIVSGLRKTNGCAIALVTDAVGFGKSFGVSSEPEGAPNKPLPPALVWDPLNMNGKELARASHVSNLNASGVQNTVTGTVYCCDLTERTKEAFYGNAWNTWHISHCGRSLGDPNEPDKKATRTVFFEPEDGPNKPWRVAFTLCCSLFPNSVREYGCVLELIK